MVAGLIINSLMVTFFLLSIDPLAQVSDFDIRLLRIFRSVVECGGFSAAETVLGIGRSAISQQMSDLEQRLGLRLCQRGRAGFSLTEEGREVYQSALQLLSALESFRTAKATTLHHAAEDAQQADIEVAHLGQWVGSTAAHSLVKA